MLPSDLYSPPGSGDGWEMRRPSQKQEIIQSGELFDFLPHEADNKNIFGSLVVKPEAELKCGMKSRYLLSECEYVRD